MGRLGAGATSRGEKLWLMWGVEEVEEGALPKVDGVEACMVRVWTISVKCRIGSGEQSGDLEETSALDSRG